MATMSSAFDSIDNYKRQTLDMGKDFQDEHQLKLIDEDSVYQCNAHDSFTEMPNEETEEEIINKFDIISSDKAKSRSVSFSITSSDTEDCYEGVQNSYLPNVKEVVATNDSSDSVQTLKTDISSEQNRKNGDIQQQIQVNEAACDKTSSHYNEDQFSESEQDSDNAQKLKVHVCSEQNEVNGIDIEENIPKNAAVSDKTLIVSNEEQLSAADTNSDNVDELTVDVLLKSNDVMADIVQVKEPASDKIPSGSSKEQLISATDKDSDNADELKVHASSDLDEMNDIKDDNVQDKTTACDKVVSSDTNQDSVSAQELTEVPVISDSNEIKMSTQEESPQEVATCEDLNSVEDLMNALLVGIEDSINVSVQNTNDDVSVEKKCDEVYSETTNATTIESAVLTKCEDDNTRESDCVNVNDEQRLEDTVTASEEKMKSPEPIDHTDDNNVALEVTIGGPSSPIVVDDDVCVLEVDKEESDCSKETRNDGIATCLSSTSSNVSIKRSSTNADDDGSTRKKLKTTDSTESIVIDSNEFDNSGDQSNMSLKQFITKIQQKECRKITFVDLEQYCMNKMCESIVYRSLVGELRQQLQQHEKTIDMMRKEMAQLTKANADLEIVNKKLIYDFKQQQQQSPTTKDLQPLRVTRSVGLQVKFVVPLALQRECNVSTSLAMKQRHPTISQLISQATPVTVMSLCPPVNSTQTSTVVHCSVANVSANKLAQSVATAKGTVLVNSTTPIRPSILKQTLSHSVIASNVAAVPASAPAPVPAPASAPTTNGISVIDLTDEDEKSPVPTVQPQPSSVTPNNTNNSGPRQTFPSTFRLNSATGKLTPITSTLTTGHQQLMYVMQPSSGGGSQPKAVLVNFQPTNGVLGANQLGGGGQPAAAAAAAAPSGLSLITSTKSVSAGNVLKTVSLAKAITTTTASHNHRILPAPAPPPPLAPPPLSFPLLTIRNSGRTDRHPAPLPVPPVVHVPQEGFLRSIPPKPFLTIRKHENGIVLQWKMPYDLSQYERIASYQLFAYQETAAPPTTDLWRKVGDVKALALPMACTLTQFVERNRYHFAVRPVDIHRRIGVFSEPEMISL